LAQSNPWRDRSAQRYKAFYDEFVEAGAGGQADMLAMRMMCMTDLGFLAREIFKMDEIRDRKSGRKRWYPGIHERFCDHLQRDEDGLYHLSRGMMKTGITQIWVIQKVLQDPARIRIGIWSQTAELIQRSLAGIKSGFQNPMLMELFPEITPPRKEWKVDNADSLTMTRDIEGVEKPLIDLKENQIEVFGVLKTAVGRHYDYHLYDDIISDRNVATGEQIEKVRSWWAATQAIKEPSAIEKIIGTPWHHMDIYATIQQENYFTKDQIFVQAGSTEDCEPIYPFFTKKWLQQQKNRMGPQLFAAQYALETRPREDRMFIRPYPQYKPEHFPRSTTYPLTRGRLRDSRYTDTSLVVTLRLSERGVNGYVVDRKSVV